MLQFLGLRKDAKKSTSDKEADGGFVIADCTDANPPPALLDVGPAGGLQSVEVTSALPDLLGDVPFTLAPHVLAMQAGSSMVPDVLLSRDVNYNLASFQYDFTLENSVLHNS
uniref:UBAP1-MVB12-associated (UMA) domain containing 1 n=1 Tax=Xiphophorus couchianus TaxID=32473 RepID=A0A3B5L802_9TELE